MAVTIDELETLRLNLDAKESAWLRQFGWEYVCNTPGARWLWRKEWKGEIYLVSQSTALDFQLFMMPFDDDAAPEPEGGSTK
jgi:hypothetical protein